MSKNISKETIFQAFGGGIHDSIDRSPYEILLRRLNVLSRFKDRILGANSNEDLADFTYTFFIYSVAFRDQCNNIVDDKVWKEAENELGLEWKVCRDLANGIKHTKLTNRSLELAEGSGPLAASFEYCYDTEKAVLICHFSINGETRKIYLKESVCRIFKACKLALGKISEQPQKNDS